LTAMAFTLVTLVPVGDLPAQQAAASSAALPSKWEELTAPNFIKAVELSGGTCIIPLGVIEKHGPHLPLGTDLIDVRAVVLRAAQTEYSIIFPEYYFSQIFEAKHQPGTIAYGERLIWDMLQNTCDEISRNGIKKIILVSGHGGNNSFLPFSARHSWPAERTTPFTCSSLRTIPPLRRKSPGCANRRWNSMQERGRPPRSWQCVRPGAPGSCDDPVG